MKFKTYHRKLRKSRESAIKEVIGEIQSKFDMKKECLHLKDFEEIKKKYSLNEEDGQ